MIDSIAIAIHESDINVCELIRGVTFHGVEHHDDITDVTAGPVIFRHDPKIVLPYSMSIANDQVCLIIALLV